MRITTIFTCIFFGATSLASGQFIAQEPGGQPTDTVQALEQPHEFAWRLFFYLSQQAKLGAAGQPDPNKNGLKEYDENRDVVWETWARATGGVPRFLGSGEANYSEVFLDNGVRPVPWNQLNRSAPTIKIFDPNLTTLTEKRVLPPDKSRGRFGPLADPGSIFPREFEVRMNQSTYETILNKDLFNVEGLENKFREAQTSGNRDIIKFERQSKEVKAKWVEITDDMKPRYHWRTTTTVQNGQPVTKLWGLAGLHIITKDIPNWFWTDFSHVDWELKTPEGTVDPRPSDDPTTRGPNVPRDRQGIRNETVGSKWEHYRLRGIQIDFFDKFGRPTELSNSLIEPIIDGPSSCITCHARATVGLWPQGEQGPKVPLFAARTLFPVFEKGAPASELFSNGYGLQYIQTDFLWSLPYRTHRKQ